MTSKIHNKNAVIIGGGFYGCATALELRQAGLEVVLLERQSGLMRGASYVNQARIHQGYHYPRSLLTALRSRVNFQRFVDEYAGCVYDRFEHYYAIGRLSSKVNAAQFATFCKRIGAPLEVAPKRIRSLFNPDLIETVFRVREFAFDAERLQQLMHEALDAAGVEIRLRTRAERVRGDGARLSVSHSDGQHSAALHADYVFNCTYSRINRIVGDSGLPLLALKHELTEMALIEVPEVFREAGFTVMDGPFFSVMPFPARELHSLSHVRYTPHAEWMDIEGQACADIPDVLSGLRASRHLHMLKDAQRYLPTLGGSRYVDSLWEVKTVLPQSELDDSRPILFSRSQGLPNLISIMGGKIDNIFDIREKLGMLFSGEGERQ